MAQKDESAAQAVQGAEAKTQESGQLKIRWDSSNMRSAYANVFNASGTREEVLLFFGMNQSWDASQKEMTVQISDRIVLSPFVAKRLSLVLNNVIRDYEAHYGKLEIEARQAADIRI